MKEVSYSPFWIAFLVSLLVCSALVSSCMSSRGISTVSADAFVRDHGYYPFRSPLDYIRTGAVIDYHEGFVDLVFDADICFPEETVRRIKGQEAFWAQQLNQTADFALKALSKYMPVDTLGGTFLQAKGVSEVKIEIPVAHVELIELGALQAYVNHPDFPSKCEQLLGQGRLVVTQTVTPDSAIFHFQSEGKVAIDFSALGLPSGVFEKVGENTLKFNQPLSIGFRVRPFSQTLGEAGLKIGPELDSEAIQQLLQTYQ